MESLPDVSIHEVKSADVRNVYRASPPLLPANADFYMGDLQPPPEKELDLDEDEDEGVSISTGCACCFWVARTARRVHGGTTCLWMELLLLAGLVYCSVEAAADHVIPPVGTFMVILCGSLATSFVSAVLRLTWARLVVDRFFPESMVMAFATHCIDPELWNLIFGLVQFILWKNLVYQDPSGQWGFGFPTESWAIGGMSATHKFILEMVLVVILLWGIRNAIVKAIMLKLMLGFLMNYSGEITGLLRKYGLLRQLNSGSVKLIPVMSAIAPGQSLLTDRAASWNREVPDTLASLNSSRALQELSRMRTVRGDVSKTQLYETIRMAIREESRSGLQKGSSKQNLWRQSSRRTSFLRPNDVADDKSLIRADDDHVRDRSGNLLPRLSSVRRKRVREFNVEIVDRVLPVWLDKKILLALPKSPIANMMAIEWVRKEPITLFVDTRRMDLTSKKTARLTGSQLFESLLSLQQSLETLQIEMSSELAQAPHEPFATRVGSSNFTTTQGRQYSREDSGSEYMIRESAAPLMQLREPNGNTPYGQQQMSGQGHAVVHSQDDVTTPGAGGREMDTNASAPHGLIGPVSLGATVPRPVISSPRPETTPQQTESLEQTRSGHHRWLSRSALKNRRNGSVSALKGSELRQNPGVAQKSQVGQGTRIPNDAQLAAITAAEIKKVKLILPDDRTCLSQDFFELFMSTADTRDLLNFLDPGRLGKVTSNMFTKGVVSLYRQRKQIVHSLESQEQIEKTFRRTCLLFITFLMILAFLVYLGVNPNTITVSGAAILSATSIVLSSVYTDFIQSTILMVFLNPYRIGDRVRIDGEAQYVRRITTYFTEFESLHGKIQYLAHKELTNKLLINESRCKMATTEVNVYFGEKTTPAQYAAFKKVLDAFLKSRPLEWVGDSLFVYVVGIGPDQYVQVGIWATHTEGWGNWLAVRTQESSLFFFIMRQATLLGITYRLPIQRWEPYLSATQTSARPAGNPQSAPSEAQTDGQRYPVFEQQGTHSAVPPDNRLITSGYPRRAELVASSGSPEVGTESQSASEPTSDYYQYADEYDETMQRIDNVEDLCERRLLGP